MAGEIAQRLLKIFSTTVERGGDEALDAARAMARSLDRPIAEASEAAIKEGGEAAQPFLKELMGEATKRYVRVGSEAAAEGAGRFRGVLGRASRKSADAIDDETIGLAKEMLKVKDVSVSEVVGVLAKGANNKQLAGLAQKVAEGADDTLKPEIVKEFRLHAKKADVFDNTLAQATKATTELTGKLKKKSDMEVIEIVKGWAKENNPEQVANMMANNGLKNSRRAGKIAGAVYDGLEPEKKLEALAEVAKKLKFQEGWIGSPITYKGMGLGKFARAAGVGIEDIPSLAYKADLPVDKRAIANFSKGYKLNSSPIDRTNTYRFANQFQREAGVAMNSIEDVSREAQKLSLERYYSPFLQPIQTTKSVLKGGAIGTGVVAAGVVAIPVAKLGWTGIGHLGDAKDAVDRWLNGDNTDEQMITLQDGSKVMALENGQLVAVKGEMDENGKFAGINARELTDAELIYVKAEQSRLEEKGKGDGDDDKGKSWWERITTMGGLTDMMKNPAVALMAMGGLAAIGSQVAGVTGITGVGWVDGMIKSLGTFGGVAAALIGAVWGLGQKISGWVESSAGDEKEKAKGKGKARERGGDVEPGLEQGLTPEQRRHLVKKGEVGEERGDAVGKLTEEERRAAREAFERTGAQTVDDVPDGTQVAAMNGNATQDRKNGKNEPEPVRTGG